MADAKAADDKSAPTNTEKFGCRELKPATPKKSPTDKSDKGDAK